MKGRKLVVCMECGKGLKSNHVCSEAIFNLVAKRDKLIKIMLNTPIHNSHKRTRQIIEIKAINNKIKNKAK